MNKYNVYNLNWEYLGCFWYGGSWFYHNLEGDYIQDVYSGKLLTKDNQELDAIEPIKVYIKWMGAA